MGGFVQTVPVQATVIRFGFSPSRPRLTRTAGRGYSIFPGFHCCFFTETFCFSVVFFSIVLFSPLFIIPFYCCRADTMEKCDSIAASLGADVCKNLFLCNRQKTNFYLLCMPPHKAFHLCDKLKIVTIAVNRSSPFIFYGDNAVLPFSAKKTYSVF